MLILFTILFNVLGFIEGRQFSKFGSGDPLANAPQVTLKAIPEPTPPPPPDAVPPVNCTGNETSLTTPIANLSGLAGEGTTAAPWTGRTDRRGRPIITSTTAPMSLKHTGMKLCKGGMVARGASVDAECSTNVRFQLEQFAGLKFESVRCENGSCVVDYRERNMVAYTCCVSEMDNGSFIGGCKIVAPMNSGITFPPKTKNAALKSFIKEEMYY